MHPVPGNLNIISYSHVNHVGLDVRWCKVNYSFYMELGDRMMLTFHLKNGLYQHCTGSGHDESFSRAHALVGILVMTTEGLSSQQIKGGELTHTSQAKMIYSSDGNMGVMVARYTTAVAHPQCAVEAQRDQGMLEESF